METEKKYFAGWWAWVLVLLILTIIVFSGLYYAGIFGRTVVERKVFEQSYQKKEADKEARTSYDAQLAILRSRLNDSTLTISEKKAIQGQIDAIKILKSTKED